MKGNFVEMVVETHKEAIQDLLASEKDLDIYIKQHTNLVYSFFLVLFWSGVYSPDYDNCSNVQYPNKQPRRLSNGDFGSD